jgi:large subunit ribosomal protein L17
MRHGKKVNHLSRQTGHRKAMLANMACSLIEHKRINTTVAKAKALKQFVEPLITKSKEDTTHNRRICFAYLRSKYAVTDLFRDVAAKVGDRPGGYTRIIKMGNRLGDNADMAMIELVDFNELYNGGKKEEKKGRTRRTKKSATTTAAPKPAPAVEEVAPIVDEAAPIVEEVIEIPATEVVETPVVEDSNDSEQAEQTPDAEVVAPIVEEATPNLEEVVETPAAEVVETPVAEVEVPEVVEDSSESEQAEQTQVAEAEAPATEETPEAQGDEESKEEEA